jgi:hypothetical protein
MLTCIARSNLARIGRACLMPVALTGASAIRRQKHTREAGSGTEARTKGSRGKTWHGPPQARVPLGITIGIGAIGIGF